MEFWNSGFNGTKSFFMGIIDQKIKSDHHPFLIPNIPFFQHSIIPSVTDHKDHTSELKSMPNLLAQDFLLDL